MASAPLASLRVTAALSVGPPVRLSAFGSGAAADQSDHEYKGSVAHVEELLTETVLRGSEPYVQTARRAGSDRPARVEEGERKLADAVASARVRTGYRPARHRAVVPDLDRVHDRRADRDRAEIEPEWRHREDDGAAEPGQRDRRLGTERARNVQRRGLRPSRDRAEPDPHVAAPAGLEDAAAAVVGGNGELVDVGAADDGLDRPRHGPSLIRHRKPARGAEHPEPLHAEVVVDGGDGERRRSAAHAAEPHRRFAARRAAHRQRRLALAGRPGGVADIEVARHRERERLTL